MTRTRPKSPPTTVFWDLGGVLVDVEKDRARAVWTRLTGEPEARFDTVFFGDGLKERFDDGRIDVDEWLETVSRRSGERLLGCQVKWVWNAMLRARREMLRLVARLAKQLRTGVISNTDPVHAELVRSLPLLETAVERWTCSFEVGCKKPEPGIYEIALDRMNVRAERAVLVDDLPENVDGARKLGLQAIQMGSPKDLPRQLAEIGIDVR